MTWRFPVDGGARWSWIGLAVVVLGTALIRLRLLDVPLDRDEGEYAYVGQLLLDGVPPFAWAYTMKMPGIHAVYAVILSTFGMTARAVHLGLLVVNAAAIVLVFLVGRRFGTPGAATTAAAAFAALTISPRVFGLAAYAEHFVVVPVLGALLALLRAMESGRVRTVFVAGCLLGLGVVLKQSAAVFVAFGVAAVVVHYAWQRPVRGTRAAVAVLALVLGAGIPFTLVYVALELAGTAGLFWFWTFRYASTYVSAVPIDVGLRLFARTMGHILPSAFLIVAVAAVGLAGVLTTRALRDRRTLLLLFLGFSAVSVTPGLYFREHYFLPALPAIALLAGLAHDVVRVHLHRRRAVALVLVGAVAVIPALQVLWAERFVLFRASPDEVARDVYGRNPFPEASVIAEYIKARTSPGDPIVVIGSEPQIYFYAHRPAATAFIYMYPLMELHPFAGSMQELMIQQIERVRPKYAVHVNVYTSWLSRPQSERRIARWFEEYGKQFEAVGFADITRGRTRYVWDDEARTYRPSSEQWVGVYRIHDNGARRATTPSQ
jgi:hypothetical protein